MSDAEVGSAVFSWEEGVRRLEATRGPVRRAAFDIVGAVHDELRRLLGASFSLSDLARAYERASDWYLPLARRVAPRHPDAWDPAVALDGAFGLYMRRASDAAGS